MQVRLTDVFLRVVAVSIIESALKLICQQLSDSRLATTRNPHDYMDQWPAMAPGAVAAAVTDTGAHDAPRLPVEAVEAP
jgi:hypothetical protein